MAVYLELIADDLDDIGGWLGAMVASSDAQVELLPDGDMYVSIDFRADRPPSPRMAMAASWFAFDGTPLVAEGPPVDDETGEGHPRTLAEVLAMDGAPAVPDLDSIRREELGNLDLMRATIAGRAGTGDAVAKAQLDAIDRRRALLLGLADLPEPDADELLPPD